MDFATPPKAARAFLEVLASKDFASLSNLIHPKSTDPTAAAIRDRKVPVTDLEAAAATLGVFEEIISESEEKPFMLVPIMRAMGLLDPDFVESWLSSGTSIP